MCSFRLKSGSGPRRKVSGLRSAGDNPSHSCQAFCLVPGAQQWPRKVSSHPSLHWKQDWLGRRKRGKNICIHNKAGVKEREGGSRR